ncbi:hypothetical protein AVEN_112402-1, partial [Araneus ventricosus]
AIAKLKAKMTPVMMTLVKRAAIHLPLWHLTVEPGSHLRQSLIAKVLCVLLGFCRLPAAVVKEIDGLIYYIFHF